MAKSYGRWLTIALACALVACGSDDDDSTTKSNITIPFQAKSGSTAISCDAALTQLGTTQDGGTVSDFAFYIHDIQLKTRSGNWIKATLDKNNFQDPDNGVALLDFQDKTDSCKGAAKPTNKVVTAAIEGAATADIVGIQFKVGVPAAINHHNASTSIAPYNRSGLFWQWQSGHKFMRLDISPTQKVKLNYTPSTQNGATPATHAATYFFHLGSTGCTGDPTTGQVVNCTAPNRPTIELTANFKITNLTTSTVVLDYAKLVDGINMNVDDAAPVGCMSGVTDPECVTMFNNLGMAHGAYAATKKQQVFSVQ